MKQTHTKSWARNLLMLDLTFGPPSRLNDGSLALVSCLSGGYRIWKAYSSHQNLGASRF